MSVIDEIRKHLFDMQDISYKEFHSKLIPDTDADTVIGVRTPNLRRYAKECVREYDRDSINEFLHALPHHYYEENNLHGFIIEAFRDYDDCIEQVDRFLPYIDNWATCDLISPKVFRRNTDRLLGRIYEWLDSDVTYTVRFAIRMLMNYYLDDNFSKEYIDTVAGIRSEEYYINMMKAWYMATALAKQYDTAVEYIEEKKMDVWSHNKSIQKAVESNRISDEHKNYLRTLRIKKQK